MRPVALRPVLAGAVLSLAAALLAGAPAGARATAAGALDQSLRIGTYNVRADVPFGDFKAAAASVKQLADVIGMQEIGSTERNQWLKADMDWGYHTTDDVQQNPIIWRRVKFDAVGFKDYQIAPDRDVKGGPKDASWATGVRLLDRDTGQQISVLNVHLVKGAVKGGLPVPGRKALFKLYAEQVAGTVQAIKAERAVAATDAVYILGDFNVGYEADIKRKHTLLPYRQYKKLGMRSMWQGSPLLAKPYGTHSDALLDQVWTTENSSIENIYRTIKQSDHWPAVATYELTPVPGFVPTTGVIGFDPLDLSQSAKEGTGKNRDPDLAFALTGDTDHGYPHLEITGKAEVGTTYEDGSDFLVDASELYDGKPGATIYVDFQGDGEYEDDETFTIKLVDPVNTVILPGVDAVTGTIEDDD